MEKLNNINLNQLIEFFTFPLQRFLSGVITGSEEKSKLEFIKELMSDAEEEFTYIERKPLFISINVKENYSNYNPDVDIESELFQNILSFFPKIRPSLTFKEQVLELQRPLLIVFNRFDLINVKYKKNVSSVIETLFETTENDSNIKINLLFLVKGSENIFDLFTEETSIKVSSIKLPIYNFNFVSN